MAPCEILMRADFAPRNISLSSEPEHKHLFKNREEEREIDILVSGFAACAIFFLSARVSTAGHVVRRIRLIREVCCCAEATFSPGVAKRFMSLPGQPDFYAPSVRDTETTLVRL